MIVLHEYYHGKMNMTYVLIADPAEWEKVAQNMRHLASRLRQVLLLAKIDRPQVQVYLPIQVRPGDQELPIAQRRPIAPWARRGTRRLWRSSLRGPEGRASTAVRTTSTP